MRGGLLHLNLTGLGIPKVEEHLSISPNANAKLQQSCATYKLNIKNHIKKRGLKCHALYTII